MSETRGDPGAGGMGGVPPRGEPGGPRPDLGDMSSNPFDPDGSERRSQDFGPDIVIGPDDSDPFGRGFEPPSGESSGAPEPAFRSRLASDEKAPDADGNNAEAEHMSEGAGDSGSPGPARPAKSVWSHLFGRRGESEGAAGDVSSGDQELLDQIQEISRAQGNNIPEEFGVREPAGTEARTGRRGERVGRAVRAGVAAAPVALRGAGTVARSVPRAVGAVKSFLNPEPKRNDGSRPGVGMRPPRRIDPATGRPYTAYQERRSYRDLTEPVEPSYVSQLPPEARRRFSSADDADTASGMDEAERMHRRMIGGDS